MFNFPLTDRFVLDDVLPEIAAAAVDLLQVREGLDSRRVIVRHLDSAKRTITERELVWDREGMRWV